MDDAAELKVSRWAVWQMGDEQSSGCLVILVDHDKVGKSFGHRLFNNFLDSKTPPVVKFSRGNDVYQTLSKLKCVLPQQDDNQ